MSSERLSSPHHSFDINLAQKYSIEEAIMIHHFQHWIEINHTLKQGFQDGLVWTYQTLEYIKAHFPYWSIDQVRTIIKKLEKKKVIRKGNFNKKSWDRTVWYTLEDQSFLNSQMHMVELPNAYGETTRPIPDTKEYTNTKEIYNVPDQSVTKKIPSEVENLKEKFYQEILKAKPDFTEKPSKNWDVVCQKLLKKRPEEQILKILRWSLNDNFWKGNVLSPNGLLNNLDQIEVRMAQKPSEEGIKERIERHMAQARRHEIRGAIEACGTYVEFIKGAASPSVCVNYNLSEKEWQEKTNWREND